MAKKTVGLVEKIKVTGKKTVEINALFDTGARRTSIDTKVAKMADLGETIRYVSVRNPSKKTKTRRPVVRAVIDIHDQKFDADVNIQDRSHMTFPAIIGRNILSGNFVVDPEKHEHVFKKLYKKSKEKI